MDFTDVCSKCGICFLRSEGHRCSSNEDMNKQFDDDEDSTPFLDKIEKESKSNEESASKLEKRSDFTASDIKEFQENTLKKVEDEYEAANFNLLKKDPLISEGNPVSPPIKKNCMEENQEDLIEANRALGENFENTFEFLSLDTSLYSDKSIAIVSQHGNPLDGLPFEYIVTDDSCDSYQSKDKNLKSAAANERQSVGSDAVTAKTVPDLRLNQLTIRVATLKRDCGVSFLSSFPEINEHLNTSEGASVTLPSGSQAGPSRIDSSRHSKSKKTPLKHSPKKSFSCGQCGMIFSDEKSYADHMILHDHPYTSKGASFTLPSGSQACSSRPDNSGRSRSVSKTPSLKHSPKKSFPCSKCGTVLSSKSSYETHLFLHTNLKPHVCKDCGKAFSNKPYLKTHYRSHTGEQRYKCSVCGKRFSQRSNLNTHFRIHTGDQPFVCEICGRTFAYQSLLCRHHRSHTT